MSKEPKISVIVPVYKAEKYLHKCVDSLLAQTFTDFEILLVDDGSLDKSGEICDEYAEKDSRIRVFHKGNGGVSSARQCGLDNARGEYVIHADPDDWVEANMLEELYAKAKEEDADMVICDFYEEYLKTGFIKHIKQSPVELEPDAILKELLHQQLHGSCCNKLVKRICYNLYRIKFPMELQCNEDLYVNIALLKNKINVVYYPKAFYHYIHEINDNSLTEAVKPFNERLKHKELFCKLMSDHKYYYLCEQIIVTNFVYSIFKYGYFSSSEFKDKMYVYRNIVISNKNIALYNRLKLYLSCIGFYKPMFFFHNILKEHLIC